jgi:hypothetical protein
MFLLALQNKTASFALTEKSVHFSREENFSNLATFYLE